MKIILQRTKRRVTESGFYLNEDPVIFSLNPGETIKVPFEKYYSKCQVKLDPCVPEDALTYNDGSFKYPKGCCCCDGK